MARPTPPHIDGLVDAHCHLDYPPMADDVDATLAAAAAAGISQLVHVGCSLARLDPALALAEAHAQVFASVGVHPHEATTLDDAAEDRLRDLARHPKVVAIGETGLDYYYDRSPRPVQIEALRRQALLAAAVELPLVLHIRDAHDDALAALDGIELPRGGMVHCFTGTPTQAERWLARGMHISFSGIATFPKASEVAEAARKCPEDRILLETDAPFLAPVPVRGRPNTPANVAFTCAHLARLRGQAPEALAAHSAQNTRALLGLPPP